MINNILIVILIILTIKSLKQEVHKYQTHKEERIDLEEVNQKKDKMILIHLMINIYKLIINKINKKEVEEDQKVLKIKKNILVNNFKNKLI